MWEYMIQKLDSFLLDCFFRNGMDVVNSVIALPSHCWARDNRKMDGWGVGDGVPFVIVASKAHVTKWNKETIPTGVWLQWQQMLHFTLTTLSFATADSWKDGTFNSNNFESHEILSNSLSINCKLITATFSLFLVPGYLYEKVGDSLVG